MEGTLRGPCLSFPLPYDRVQDLKSIFPLPDDRLQDLESFSLPDDRVQETRVAAIRALLKRPIIPSPLYSHLAKII